MQVIRRLTLAAAVGALLTAAAAAQTPQPAAPQPTRIAIIDMQVAISKCTEGQQAAKEITDRFSPKRADLEKQQKEITDLQQQLQTQDKALSDDARNKLLRTIDDKTRVLQRNNDDANTEMQSAEQDAINEIGRKMMPILNDYAKKNSFTVILDVSNPQTPVLYAEPGMDITQQIIALYDQANTAKPAVSSGAPSGTPASAASKSAPAAGSKPAGGSSAAAAH